MTKYYEILLATTGYLNTNCSEDEIISEDRMSGIMQNGCLTLLHSKPSKLHRVVAVRCSECNRLNISVNSLDTIQSVNLCNVAEDFVFCLYIDTTYEKKSMEF